MVFRWRRRRSDWWQRCRWARWRWVPQHRRYPIAGRRCPLLPRELRRQIGKWRRIRLWTVCAYNWSVQLCRWGGGGGGILVAQHSLIICRVNGHLQRKIICVLAAEVLAEGRASLLATSSSMHKEFTRETGNLSLPRSATRHIQRHRPHPHHRRRPRRRPRRRRPRRRPRRRRRRRQAAPAAASIP